MNVHYYSKKELESMSNEQLLDYAKIMTIPADSNWKTEQIISVTQYHQKHNSQNFGNMNLMKYVNASTLMTMFIIFGSIYLKSTASCPTGLCDVSNGSNDSIADAINSSTHEFSSIFKKSMDEVEQRDNDLMSCMEDLERLQTNCQQNVRKVKQENQVASLELHDELEKCWATSTSMVQ